MAIIFLIIEVQKSGLGGFQRGHYIKKQYDQRSLEVAKS